jgi:hypothetical protein
MQRFILLALLNFVTNICKAQPTEAEIRKQITNAGTRSITFTKSTGTRQWNRDIGNWEYVRGVEVVRKSDYPGIDLMVAGDVVYQYTGVGKYSYWKFRTISNQYLGIPNPTVKEISDFISRDWQKFYGYYYTVITQLLQQPVLADEPGWTWHSPNSVEFRMKLKFDYIISNTETETLDCIWKVRLYRDDPKTAWKNMLALRSEEAADLKVIGKKQYTNAQIDDLRKQTLAYTMAEEQAKLQSASLPQMNVPEFATAEDLVKFMHNILRNGDESQFRAAMIKLMAQGFFIEGSSVQLRPDVEQAMRDVVIAAYRDKSTYKQMYCQNPSYRIEKWADGSRKSIYIPGAVNDCNSMFLIGPVNAGYKEGVPQTKLRILEFNIRVRQDADAINYVNSFSDRKKMCPGDN